MSRKYFFSIVFIICSYLLTFVPLAAQEKEGEIIIISERVGEEIDQQEREKFKLFEEIKGFQSAVHIKLPDGRYFLKITYRDEETGELKSTRIQQSEAIIKNRGNYIDHFEEIEEIDGEIIIISNQVGKIIDQIERDKYELFQEVKGFQSATFFKLPLNKFILKIMYKEEQTDELKIDRIPQSKESINKYRYHINHFDEIKARKHQDLKKDAYQEPCIALFWEMFGKPFGSLNLDIRIKKSSSVSLGIIFYDKFTQTNDYLLWVDESKLEDGEEVEVHSLMPNIMYYYLIGEKKKRFEIGGGFSVRPVWHEYVNGDFPLAFHGVIGYRYQKRRGLLFRVGLTPSYFPKAGFVGWPWRGLSSWMGISFGYSF